MTIKTVLIADVDGMPGPSDAKNTLWARLSAAIHAYGGDVQPQPNGALLAEFAPATSDDDAERAIRAGLAMLTELTALHTERTAAGKPPFAIQSIGIGVNTGPVDTMRWHTATIHQTDESAIAVAALLQNQAPAGAVLISHSTFRQVRGMFDLAPLDAVSVDDRSRASAYIVERPRPRAFRSTTRGVGGVETHIVGRHAARQHLKEALTAVVQAGESRTITLTGPPGIGKSRLLYEVQNHVDLMPEEAWLFRARASREMTALPYALIRSLFAARAEILNSDTAATAREKLAALIHGFRGETSDSDTHFLGRLLGIDYPYSPYLRGMDGYHSARRATRAIVDFFVAVAADDPVMIFIEDAQWADDASLELLQMLAGCCPRRPLLLLIVARPTLLDRYPDWDWGPGHEVIDLEPLSDEESAALVDEILRKMARIPPGLRGQLIAGAGGNPLAIEERVLTLIDTGVITREHGLWQASMSQMEGRRFPDDLDSLLLARLATLEPSQQGLLEQAAVLGDHFWAPALAAIAGVPEDDRDLHAALRELQARDYIVAVAQSWYSATREYRFKHSRLRDLVYHQSEQRHIYHGRAAHWLVTRSTQRVDELAGLYAYHYAAAGRQVQAMEYFARAGQQAQRTGAFAEARNFFERALAMMDASESLSRHATLMLQLGEVQWQLGDFEVAHRTLEHSLGLARDIGDRVVIAATLAILGRVARSREAYGQAEDLLGESLEIARSIGDRAGMAVALNDLGQTALAQGQRAAARALFERSLQIYRSLSDGGEVARTIANLAEVAFQEGDRVGMRTFAHMALTAARDSTAVLVMLEAIIMLGYAAALEGEKALARRYLSVAAHDPGLSPELHGRIRDATRLGGISLEDEAPAVGVEHLAHTILAGET